MIRAEPKLADIDHPHFQDQHTSVYCQLFKALNLHVTILHSTKVYELFTDNACTLKRLTTSGMCCVYLY